MFLMVSGESGDFRIFLNLCINFETERYFLELPGHCYYKQIPFQVCFKNSMVTESSKQEINEHF